MAQKKDMVLTVIGSLERGGCETHLLQVLPELVQKGHDVRVFILAFSGSLAPEFEARGVKLIRPWFELNIEKPPVAPIRLLRHLTTAVQLALYCVTKQPTIMHFFLPASYWLGGPIGLLTCRAKRIMSRRSLNHYMNSRRFSRPLEMFLHRRMHALLGNSAAVVRQLVKDEDAPSRQVGLIYNGVDASRVPDNTGMDLRRELGISDDTLVLTTVANLIPYKGHMDLLEALGQAQIRRSWCLLLAGRDDGHGAALEKRAADLGILDRVKFLGSFSPVSRLLAASDIFVLPSHEEGFSNALLEAMVASVGIIATDVGGNTEAVEDGVNGLIVPSRNPVSLSAAIEKLANDADLRQMLGSAAGDKARSSYSIETCVEQYELLYRILMDKQPLSHHPAFNIIEKA
ncbi:glycosyltransferase [Aestuariispira insulae]|uniref:Glycosyltransferase involved in cell wall biosynthesis n=1 Tax=Aestuariispira insulae TaxID=1461337 RepID=A0A3D9H482_9PROT|nr:glycosyltransferase [Aestuariispira insulae]RED44280.1 glycosyltransferase involved in cell wall biosynthesis [Aestuariispira insulae]